MTGVTAAARAEALRWLRDQVKRQRGGYFDVLLAMLEEAGVVTGLPHNEARELRRRMQAARLELPEPVWDDLNAHVEASLAREQTERERAEKAEAERDEQREYAEVLSARLAGGDVESIVGPLDDALVAGLLTQPTIEDELATERERAERAEAEVNALVHVYKTGGIAEVLALLAALSAREPGKEAEA